MKESIAKIPVFVTVRSTSSRLPGKCFLPFGNGSVLEHIIRRAKYYDLDPTVCTTTEVADDTIVELAKEWNVKFYRGPVANKLLRWSQCCEHFDLEAFHSVDADDPFFCGEEINRSFSLLQTGFDMVAPSPSSSAGGANVGYSLTADIVKLASLGTKDELDTEMILPHLERVPKIRKALLSDPIEHVVRARMTLDYNEDYTFLEVVRSTLGNMASRADISKLLIENPSLVKINNFRTEQWEKNQEVKTKLYQPTPY